MDSQKRRTSRRENDACPCRSCHWEGLHEATCAVHQTGAEEEAYVDGMLPRCDCGLRRAKALARVARPES